MNSKQEELQQMYDKELSAAADTQPTVLVLDSNWRALIALNNEMAQAQIESCQVDSDLAVGIDSIVSGVATMASIIEDESAEDTEYARKHTDSKALAEERERKEALVIHMG